MKELIDKWEAERGLLTDLLAKNNGTTTYRNGHVVLAFINEGIAALSQSALDIQALRADKTELVHQHNSLMDHYQGLQDQLQALKDENEALRGQVSDNKCPDCQREKARSAYEIISGACPKWYATRDYEAWEDCGRSKAARLIASKALHAEEVKA